MNKIKIHVSKVVRDELVTTITHNENLYGEISLNLMVARELFCGSKLGDYCLSTDFCKELINHIDVITAGTTHQYTQKVYDFRGELISRMKLEENINVK